MMEMKKLTILVKMTSEEQKPVKSSCTQIHNRPSLILATIILTRSHACEERERVTAKFTLCSKNCCTPDALP